MIIITPPGTPVSIYDAQKGFVTFGFVEEVIIGRGLVISYKISYWSQKTLMTTIHDASEVVAREPETSSVGFQ